MTVKIFLSATDFPIQSVKIFGSGGEAEVTRIFPLDLTDFPKESLVIEISKLPTLSHGALRPPVVTTGSADLPILDYYHSDGRPNLFNGQLNVNSDVLRDLNAKYTSLEDERQLRQKSFTFLSTYMDSLAQGKTPANIDAGPAQLVKFFDEFVELGKSRSEVIAVLDQQISDIRQEISEETKRLQHEHFSLAATVTIVLAPLPTNTVNAQLELVYRVKATWKPIYEVHVTTTNGVPSPAVMLKYRCQISQRTGEDWNDVELVVTTAKPDIPLARVGLPEPKNMVLVQKFSQPLSHFHKEGLPRTQNTPFWNTPGQGSAFSNILSAQQHPAPSGIQGSLFASTQYYGPANQVLFGSAQAQSQPGQTLFGSQHPAQSQASSSTFVDAPSTHLPSPNTFGGGSAAPSNPAVPSVQHPQTPRQDEDGVLLAEFGKDITHTATTNVFIPSRMEAHCVLIATIPLNASFMRITAPAVDSRVFCICEITNTSEYVLPPGPVHTYLNGKHVSDDKITDSAQPQTIQCSLGVDSAVNTEFERLTANSDTGHPFGTDIKMHTIRITIKNTYEKPIDGLIVRAALPVPQNPRITISLREPGGLSLVSSDTIPVRDNCSVRWSTAEGRTGRNGGVFEWVCRDVQPGSQVLKAAWDITAPVDFDVIEQ